MAEKWTKNSAVNKQMIKLIRSGEIEDFMNEDDIARLAKSNEAGYALFKPYANAVVKQHLKSCRNAENSGKVASGGEYIITTSQNIK